MTNGLICLVKGHTLCYNWNRNQSCKCKPTEAFTYTDENYSHWKQGIPHCENCHKAFEVGDILIADEDYARTRQHSYKLVQFSDFRSSIDFQRVQ